MTGRWLEDARDREGQGLRTAFDEAERFMTSDVRRRAVWQRVQNPKARTRLVRRGFVTGVLASAAVGAVLFPIALRVLERQQGTDAVTVAPVRRETPTIEPLPVAPAEPLPERLRTADEPQRFRLGEVATLELEPRSEVTVDPAGRPRVERGASRFSVARRPGDAPYVVAVARYSLVVLGTRFSVRQDDGRVSVDVEEGLVEVHDVGGRIAELRAGQSWRSVEAPSAAFEEAPPAVHRPLRKQPAAAKTSAAAKVTAPAPETPAQRLSTYRRLAAEDNPQAENALYEMGRIYRDQLGDDREALATFERYRTRYPNGRLRAEADVFIVETLTRLRENGRALEEAKRFLAQHPRSERRPEVARLAGDLLRARGDCRQAVGFYTAAATARTARGDVAEAAAFQQAWCLRALGEPGARVALERYLRDHPNGRHVDEARRMLTE